MGVYAFLEIVNLSLLDKPYKTWKLVIISRMVMRGNCLYNAQNFENERIICMGMIITVDGPSGAGKGTLCYALAEKLGYAFY